MAAAKKNSVVGSLPPAGKSALLKAVVGKRLPRFLISIPSLHTLEVRQRLINAAAPNST